ncbi:srs domain-containing protein [Neospora caninum Liverpool]|uniref:Srs domain-containing protein n=1 Tax=Neospora caninum (strain Liverpool) TaxID=572307 RepID=F0VAB5_NEOCL|nr:srs domain-containing protein [Neospora caninum Liverpool]CBZ50604.1 srs domain-containing protein [Neospora caninum Liverpool]CEL65216.1 TPA: SRS domain-containing protein [Neospora caninum Liverpool]|eukprot:XP_003880637.1 srs domain-containing protein [Neospora caninum Liverpool]
MIFRQGRACVAALGCLVAAVHVFGNLSLDCVRATSVGSVGKNTDDKGKVASTKIDLDPEDLHGHVYLPLVEQVDPMRLEEHECRYPADGEGVGRLDLRVTENLIVGFHCHGGTTEELTPDKGSAAFRVNSDGYCDTTTVVDVDTLTPNALFYQPSQPDGRLVGNAVFFAGGLPLDSEKKACFVCKGKTVSNKGKSCEVIVTVPKASLPNSWVCNPEAPPSVNTLAFRDDGTAKEAFVHCPPGYSKLDSPDKDGYVMTGPQCMTKAKLEDVLGSGSTIKTVELKSPPSGVSKSYQVTATSSFPKPRMLCMKCFPGDSEDKPSETDACLLKVLLPVFGEKGKEAGKTLEQTTGETETPSETTTSAGVVLSCATSAALLAPISVLMSVAM